MAEDKENAPKQETNVEPAATPAPEAPKEEAPAAKAPEAKAPETKAPKAKAPKAKAPEAPAAEAKADEAPEAEAAEAPAPEAAEAAPASKPAPQLAEGKRYIWGTGRRKSAVARVRIRPGSGKFIINKREANKYFWHEEHRQMITSPLEAAKMLKSWDIFVNVGGGGFGGQAGAVVLGLARALSKAAPEVEHDLRGHGMLTRDARMKERKKYGQRGARRRFQFSKR